MSILKIDGLSVSTSVEWNAFAVLVAKLHALDAHGASFADYMAHAGFGICQHTPAVFVATEESNIVFSVALFSPTVLIAEVTNDDGEPRTLEIKSSDDWAAVELWANITATATTI